MRSPRRRRGKPKKRKQEKEKVEKKAEEERSSLKRSSNQNPIRIAIVSQQKRHQTRKSRRAKAVCRR